MVGDGDIIEIAIYKPEGGAAIFVYVYSSDSFTSVYDVNPPYTLEKIAEGIINYNKDRFGSLLDKSQTTLLDEAATKISLKGEKFRTDSIVTMYDDRIYMIDYRATPESYEENLPIFNKVIESFRVI